MVFPRRCGQLFIWFCICYTRSRRVVCLERWILSWSLLSIAHILKVLSTDKLSWYPLPRYFCCCCSRALLLLRSLVPGDGWCMYVTLFVVRCLSGKILTRHLLMHACVSVKRQYAEYVCVGSCCSSCEWGSNHYSFFLMTSYLPLLLVFRAKVYAFL